MRSGTSCFNTVFRKNLTRFWPLWAVYGLIWIFVLPLNLVQIWLNGARWDYPAADIQRTVTEFAVNVPEYLIPGLFLAAVFGLFCAMAVFGYLYTGRSVCMMHALPMDRKQLFTAQYLGGLAMLLLPNLAVAAVTAALELCLLPAGGWGTALSALGLWLAVQCGICLFFFSFAAFCAMFTGNTLALPVFYGVLNFLVSGVYLLVSALMAEFFYGFSVWSVALPRPVAWMTPFVKLMDACSWVRPYWTDRYQLADPAVVAVYAAAGVVLSVLAAAVYKYRHAESAGDVVAIPLVRPVFRCGVSFCAGLSMGIFTASFFGWFSSSLLLTLLVLLWTAVGWFVAEMFLRRSFRVLKAWKGCVAMTAAVALLCAACMFDLFGVQNRIPELDRVESVTVNGNLMGYPSDGAAWNEFTLTKPEEIQKIMDLQQAILDWHNGGEDAADPDRVVGEDLRLTLIYRLKGGVTMTREYYSVSVGAEDREQPGTVAYALEQLIEDRDIVAGAYGLDKYDLSAWITDTWEGGTYHANRDHNVRAYLDGARAADGSYNTVFLDGAAGENLDSLWEAVQADFKAGTLGKRYLFDFDRQRLEHTCRTDLILEFNVDGVKGGDSLANVTITLTPEAENTLNWLRENSGLDTEYTVPTYGQWQDGEYDDTAGKVFDAATGDEIIESTYSVNTVTVQ